MAYIVSTTASAEILKCLEEDGSISYSDQTCGNAPMVGYISIEAITPAGLITLQNYKAQRSAKAPTFPYLENQVQKVMPGIVENQASRPIRKIRFSMDVETVSQARDTLATIDRLKMVR